MKKIIIGFLSAFILCGVVAHDWRVEQVRNITNENAHNFWEMYYHDSLLTVQRQCLEAIEAREKQFKQRCEEEMERAKSFIRQEAEDSLNRLMLIVQQEMQDLLLENDSLRQEIILVHRSYTRYGHQPVPEMPSAHLQLIHREAIDQHSPQPSKVPQRAAIQGLKRDFGRYLLLLLLTPFLAGMMLRLFLKRR